MTQENNLDVAQYIEKPADDSVKLSDAEILNIERKSRLVGNIHNVNFYALSLNKLYFIEDVIDFVIRCPNFEGFKSQVVCIMNLLKCNNE